MDFFNKLSHLKILHLIFDRFSKILMKNILRVAFIYEKSNIFLSGTHFDNIYYNFFINALKRNSSIQVTDYPTEKESFDTKILKDNTDIILLFTNNEFGMPKKLIGIQELDIPVISMLGDPGVAKQSIPYHKKFKIDYYFHFLHESFVHELYPLNFKYKQIIFGVEPTLYDKVTPFKNRIKNKILNSGAIGNTKFISRIINSIRNPKWNALQCYNLRTKCSTLPYVDYTPTLNHKFVNDQYPVLLQKYAAGIAANSINPNVKYWEISAAGCLTFMEITKKNKGRFLGYEDGKTAIFINENNYQEKFQEFLSDPDNPKWEKIANAGRDYTLKHFSNDVGVSSLVDLMKYSLK